MKFIKKIFRKRIQPKARIVIVSEKQAYVVIDKYSGKLFLWGSMNTSRSPDYSSCTHTKKEAENLCRAYNEIYVTGK